MAYTPGPTVWGDKRHPIWDANQRIKLPYNLGTAGTGTTITATYGDGVNMVTVLTLSGVAITLGDNAALGSGVLIYTFPAGIIGVNAAHINVGITSNGTPTTDTPDVGLGTVVASGAVSVLSGTATFENIMTGQTFDDIAGTKEVKTVQTPLVIEASGAHTVYFNAADTYADTTDATASVNGTVVLYWTFLPTS